MRSTVAGNKFTSVCIAALRVTAEFLIGAYRMVGAQHFGGACRFEPSCSVYAQEAFRVHPPHHALSLTARRLMSCRPGGRWGYDPVPPRATVFGSELQNASFQEII
jgi:putative membrane protein insertion efficiency factor